MGCGDVRLLKTIGSVDFTGQERAALNKLTMPPNDNRSGEIPYRTFPSNVRTMLTPARVDRTLIFDWLNAPSGSA